MSEMTSAEIEQMQEEAYALIGAWMDRGFRPTQAAMVLAATANSVLAKMGISLDEYIEVVTDGWTKNNGKR
jgi:hypothetical protein